MRAARLAKSPMTFVSSRTYWLPTTNDNAQRFRRWSSTSTGDESHEETKRRVLDAAEKYVGAHGWSNEALARGARDLGLSAAAHGQFSRGPVELVEHVATRCLIDLSNGIDDRADDLANLPGWRPRLELAIELRLKLSQPWHQHRAQALSIMLSSPSADGLIPPEPAAMRALVAIGNELARATLVDGDEMSKVQWRARRAAATGAYALAEARALSDTSQDLDETIAFSKRVVHTLGDAAEAPDALRDALRAGMLAAASLGTAALAFLPPKAVGALPQLLDVAALRATSTFSKYADLSLVSTIAQRLIKCRSQDRLLNALPPSPVPRPPRKSREPVPPSNTSEASSDSGTYSTPPDPLTSDHAEPDASHAGKQ